MPTPELRLDELLLRLRRAHDNPHWHKRLFEGVAHELTSSEVRLLSAVEKAESAGRRPSLGEVADALGVEQSTASRAVAQAMGGGVLDKTRSDTDLRRCHLALTATGREALVETRAKRKELTSEVVAQWSRADLKALTTLLERLADDFDRFGQ